MNQDHGPILQLTAVGKTYPGPPPVEALKPCDLVVERADLLAVVGPSGSGKSTLLHILGLLDRPSQGSYALGGTSTSELTEAQRCGLRAHELGFVFQSFHLMPHRSAVENVELGLVYQGVTPRERRRRAVEELHRLGLDDRMWADPTKLSGGERQRVAIARAVVRRPSILLCDEPTGNLDSVHGRQILDALKELSASGIAVVVITHDLEVARRATRTVEIRDGRVSERSFDELTK